MQDLGPGRSIPPHAPHGPPGVAAAPAASAHVSLPPCPDGWFLMATSDEVKPGKVISRRLADEDVVLYRTAGGRLRAVRPYCPHLGAHLGHGGTVRGENLVCPFHHFQFDPEGACVRTGYGTAPPRARLGRLEHREIDGLVLVWRHARGLPPSWEVEVPPAADFPAPHRRVRTLAAHPQDFMENAIDFGHFAALHRLVVDITDPPRFEGARMETAYRLGRAAGQRNGMYSFGPSVRTVVQGLGVMYGEAENYGFRLRIWFCVTPVGPRHVRMCLTAAVRHTRPGRTGAARVVAALLPRAVTYASGLETGKDVPVWEHMAHLERPRLVEGDGPITRFRRWARQFYSEPL